MTFLPPLDIKGRLSMALALLTLSTISVGAIAWYGLDRANTQMQALHSQTLAQVAKSLELSKRSSDIATSAPFLLNYRSQYLIDREGQSLITTLEHIVSNWPSQTGGASSPIYAYEAEISDAIGQMQAATKDLIGSANGLNYERNVTQIRVDSIRKLERDFYGHAIADDAIDGDRSTWFLLQALSNALSGAAHSKNLLGVGEYHRRYQTLLTQMRNRSLRQSQTKAIARLAWLADGSQGLFEIRRRELSHRLAAQNALFRIRLQAVYISDLSARFAENAENFLSQGRRETSNNLDVIKVLILFGGLLSIGIALASAFFVSRYVTANIEAITHAMVRLARGDRSTKLSLKISANDEIAKLIHSFRKFRATTLRLDRSNRQLKLKNALFERVFGNITDGVAITSEDGRITAVNDSFANVLKLSHGEPIGNRSLDGLLAQTVFAEDVPDCLRLDAFEGFSVLAGSDGSIIEVRHSPLVDGGGVWLFSDATERKRVEERLTQIRHIEGLGKVSGEVAHDFGNVLSSITANIHLFERYPDRDKAQDFIDRIKNATEIGTSLVQRLLAFARKQALAPELLDLTELIEGLSDLISVGLKEDVCFETRIAPSPLMVKVDPGQLENAVLNLCINSNQAIDQSGKIVLEVGQDDNGNAYIEVSDNGVGMSNNTKERAFEPFYSERSDGSSGTGLGLAMVYGFIKQSGGDIEIDSAPEKGTKIRLILPLASPETVVPDFSAQELRALVIEDNPSDRHLAERLLSSLGVSAHSAPTYSDAEAVIVSQEGFDLLISDLHLNDDRLAWPLIEQALQTRPGLSVLLISGHMPAHHPFQDANKFPTVHCFAKPLNSEILIDILSSRTSGTD
ncbi:HAMP domain-containing protein [Cohaesibacter sp. CAU 1516]|uniref:sensor histidine kinase n=1 Tax=Cohaesibacter sp. CAU 1516 TaxID=2576038 RepID=UPI0010FE1185|nr:ATP-binding protein [Cohaesibacter sp. CAU 1516]TLP49284.1 HAMP domain-containing protein [Cohaesibacter sp. CAU 1516]